MAYDDSIDDSIDDLDCLLHQVAMHEAGLRGSFFPATVIRVPPSIKSAPRDSPLVLVEYDTLDDDDGEPIADLVALCQLRPMQPSPPKSARWLETLQIGWQLEVIAA
jgi:hypothetical protein